MSKVQDNPGASDKAIKKEAQAQGAGADNAPGHTAVHPPTDAAVVNDAGNAAIGITGGVDNKASNHIVSGDQKSAAANEAEGIVNIGGAPTANVPPEHKA